MNGLLNTTKRDTGDETHNLLDITVNLRLKLL